MPGLFENLFGFPFFGTPAGSSGLTQLDYMIDQQHRMNQQALERIMSGNLHQVARTTKMFLLEREGEKEPVQAHFNKEEAEGCRRLLTKYGKGRGKFYVHEVPVFPAFPDPDEGTK